ncbi:gfo/Idh/MocA family oxidoreductase [Mucilaginibacter hurinus]|uniref:Gfo/Idh/MocA family oxidoreductase n=1 Tax=Mucilaginibacter hurinus TaxID=2201324 RepID=A0A367GLV8_9SPHI|nr:Gfo/Idh/MocA family oxidoreductase [Mucilaginibacter hurinus]RCH53673.1 gfo/Idh/MocA family oxidoreductase [Mucilaginibacter hurinus]
MKRRNFLGQASILAAGAGIASVLPLNVFGTPRKIYSASDTINLALIGINGMGWYNLNIMRGLPGIKAVAICDVDQRLIDKRVAELAKDNIKVKTYTDYRKLLADKDIDAVIIGTPDHWHCLMMVEAVQAGKDVYVEKPAGSSVVECAAMVAAGQKYKQAIQVGQWQRSVQHFQDAVNFVQSGKLGKVRSAKAWAYIGWKDSVPKQPDIPTPPGVNYDMWLGPAAKRPFNINRFHFNFRWFWDFGGGLMTDWGVHMIDFALIAMKAGSPKSITSTGGKFAFPDDAQQTPDTMTTVYEYDDFFIQWEQAMGIAGGPYGRDHGVAFIGNNGTLVLNRNGWEVIPEIKGDKALMEAVPLQKPTDQGLVKHCQNFFDVIRSRKFDELKCPITAGAHIATISQMGNIAYRVGDKLHWDDGKKLFTNSDANKLLSASYHNGYKIPKG